MSADASRRPEDPAPPHGTGHLSVRPIFQEVCVPNSPSAVVSSFRAGRRGLAHWAKAAVGLGRSSRATGAACHSLLRTSARLSVLLEPLEDRQLMSVVYLSSSSGNDHNSGKSSSAAVKSIGKAAALTHAGDTLLLKSGDSWNTGLGNWSKSGVTISSYGTGPKPHISSTDDGIQIIKASNFSVRNISFTGLNKTGRSGIVTSGGNSNLTFDSVDITGYRMNITLQGYYGAINGVRILNSRIAYANGVGMSSGLFADKVNNLTIANSVFDHNGGTGSVFNHGAYVTATCNNLIVTGSTFSFNSATGLQARCGGIITGNTFKSNAISLTIGIVNGAGVHKDGGVTATVTGNTFTGKGVGLNNGYGIYAGNIKSGTITNNKFVNGPGVKYGYPISLNRGSAAGKQVGVRNLVIAHNTISNWGSTKIYVASNAGAYNVQIFDNKAS
jgi:hypothetical protein